MVILIPFGSDALVNVTLDLAFVIHNLIEYQAAISPAQNLLRNMTTVFQMGQDRTRLVIVDSDSNGWRSLGELTGDQKAYSNSVDKMSHQSKLDENMGNAFKFIREKILADPSRPRAILVLSRRNRKKHAYCCADQVSDQTHVHRERDLLRSDQIRLFIVAGCDDQFVSQYEETAGKGNFIHVPRLAYPQIADIVQMKNRTYRDLCHYVTGCFYSNADRSNCVKMWWTPDVRMYAGECNAFFTTPTPFQQSCTSDECEKMCDQFWPWSTTKPDCAITCGVGVTRKEGTYEWKELKFCPITHECGPCPTATTVITTTVTAITTTTTASTTSSGHTTTDSSTRTPITEESTITVTISTPETPEHVNTSILEKSTIPSSSTLITSTPEAPEPISTSAADIGSTSIGTSTWETKSVSTASSTASKETTLSVGISVDEGNLSSSNNRMRGITAETTESAKIRPFVYGAVAMVLFAAGFTALAILMITKCRRKRTGRNVEHYAARRGDSHASASSNSKSQLTSPKDQSRIIKSPKSATKKKQERTSSQISSPGTSSMSLMRNL